MDVDDTRFVFDPQHALEHHSDLFELGTLSGFLPPGRRLHARNADAGVAELTRPANSSMRLGLVPTAATTVGAGINVGMGRLNSPRLARSRC